MVTKNVGGREGHINSALVWHCDDRGLYAIWTCRFSVNNLFPFPLATALLIGDVTMNKQSGVKMFLSAITPPIVLAHLIDFLIRRCYVTPCKFDPPCLFKIWIRLRQYIGADVLFPLILLALWIFTAGIFKQSMVDRNREGKGLSYRPARLHRLAIFIPWNRFPGSINVQKYELDRMGKLVSSYWPKFAALRLFVETMPIYKAVATGKGKNEF